MPIVKVVTMGGEVEQLTRAGWELQEIRKEEVCIPSSVQVEKPSPYGTNNPPILVWEQRTSVVKQLVYILRLNDDSALAQLNAELDATREYATRLKKECDAAEKALKDQRDHVSRLLEVNERLAANVTSAHEAHNVVAVQVGRYERSIGAIRKEIGEARMREILDAAGLGEKKPILDAAGLGEKKP